MANPILSRVELATSSVPLTTQGVVRKTGFLLGLTALSGVGFYAYAGTLPNQGFVSMLAMVSAILAFVLGLAICFKPMMAKTLAIPYAITEGVFVGALSLMANRYYPMIGFTALSATLVTAFVMLALYRSGVIKVTEKFRSVMMGAILAITILYLVQLVMRLMGGSIPLIFNGGIVAIGFSVFVTIIASLSLLLDFDNVDRAKSAGVGQEYEWVLGVGILSTLVWMYVEFLRLLSNLQNR